MDSGVTVASHFEDGGVIGRIMFDRSLHYTSSLFFGIAKPIPLISHYQKN